jgi:6,7-dimethyl-8-ribityllumazine synthase
MTTLKGPGEPKTYDGKRMLPRPTSLALLPSQYGCYQILTNTSLGSGLRIGIVHARWNTTIIDALLDGAKKALKQAGVKDENIVLQSVPGSYELPYAVKQYVFVHSTETTPIEGI